MARVRGLMWRRGEFMKCGLVTRGVHMLLESK
ncbi:hypothetical protein BOTNAR_0509g00050 [Botryotinia narcissicola]|uniref:Uncharacterized protein n=1 Tax=Botryotinia narcissicola TaxID=278944 RepID=A0A4Z1HG10_9HELO|nr:hypothetical protein BOTNAR_0509g00050 [Botryotinia narcissicola]